MLRGRDIIVVGQQPWDTEIGSNCKNIALEFSKANRVLYVNSPLDRITLYRNKGEFKTQKRLAIIKGKEDGLVLIEPNLWNLYPDCMVESINWIKSTFIFNVFNSINNRKLANSIKKAIDRLGFKDFILFNDNEIFKGFYLNDFLMPKVSVYYSRDYMIAVDYWKKHGEKLEPELIKKNDLCVANSTFLADYCRKYNPNSFYVGQGCDLDIFVRKRIERSHLGLGDIEGPIIGYVGALQSIRLDQDILLHIAVSKPDWTIVLVGPEDDLFKASKLHQLENVIFLGIKTVSELPDFINVFDVCINPQLVNLVTMGNYPRKIDEYLAVGKPVVATATKAMETFANYVYLAESKEEYVTLIETAMAEDSEFHAIERRNFALEHTWENSVRDIYAAIDKVNSNI
ncbi:MAG: glycosyltransferase family 1 protein [Flavobacteriales bacterium]|nr:MAG: glycosyltransferase family 1 protein [Flavobacteriales bacterium]